MTPFLTTALDGLPDSCLTQHCQRDGCSLSLTGAPQPNFVVDLDAESLGITNETRCDYLFVSDAEAVCIVPVEFKRGSLSATHALKQLAAGAEYASEWLPHSAKFHFVPILAHKGLPKAERNTLRKRTVRFRNRRALPKLVRCGTALAKHV